MGKKHYHVLGGLSGYMPDVNDVYLTLSEARNALKDEVASAREIGYKCMKSGEDYWECYRRKPKDRWMEIPYVIYISECDMDECLEEGIEAEVEPDKPFCVLFGEDTMGREVIALVFMKPDGLYTVLEGIDPYYIRGSVCFRTRRQASKLFKKEMGYYRRR